MKGGEDKSERERGMKGEGAPPNKNPAYAIGLSNIKILKLKIVRPTIKTVTKLLLPVPENVPLQSKINSWLAHNVSNLF